MIAIRRAVPLYRFRSPEISPSSSLISRSSPSTLLLGQPVGITGENAVQLPDHLLGRLHPLLIRRHPVFQCPIAGGELGGTRQIVGQQTPQLMIRAGRFSTSSATFTAIWCGCIRRFLVSTFLMAAAAPASALRSSLACSSTSRASARRGLVGLGKIKSFEQLPRCRQQPHPEKDQNRDRNGNPEWDAEPERCQRREQRTRHAGNQIRRTGVAGCRRPLRQSYPRMVRKASRRSLVPSNTRARVISAT